MSNAISGTITRPQLVASVPEQKNTPSPLANQAAEVYPEKPVAPKFNNKNEQLKLFKDALQKQQTGIAIEMISSDRIAPYNYLVADSDGNTPLHLAIMNGNRGIIEFMLDQLSSAIKNPEQYHSMKEHILRQIVGELTYTQISKKHNTEVLINKALYTLAESSNPRLIELILAALSPTENSAFAELRNSIDTILKEKQPQTMLSQEIRLTRHGRKAPLFEQGLTTTKLLSSTDIKVIEEELANLTPDLLNQDKSIEEREQIINRMLEAIQTHRPETIANAIMKALNTLIQNENTELNAYAITKLNAFEKSEAPEEYKAAMHKLKIILSPQEAPTRRSRVTTFLRSTLKKPV